MQLVALRHAGHDGGQLLLARRYVRRRAEEVLRRKNGERAQRQPLRHLLEVEDAIRMEPTPPCVAALLNQAYLHPELLSTHQEQKEAVLRRYVQHVFSYRLALAARALRRHRVHVQLGHSILLVYRLK